MRTAAQLLEAIERVEAADRGAAARELLALAEETLEAWVAAARGEAPADGEREGFRLLALHHQGARGIPSFNACRETCREIAYHYNLIGAGEGDGARNVEMMRLLVRHIACFVHGKMQVERLGEFCCASKPLRAEADMMEP